MSIERFPDWGRLWEYDYLVAQLLSRLSETLPPADFWSLEKDEQRVAIAICRATQLTPEQWERLSLPERVPWLEVTIESLTATSAQPQELLSKNEYRILSALRNAHPKRLLMVDLAAAADLDRKTCGETTARLTARGLADYNPTDRQGAAVTSAGAALLPREPTR